MGLDKLGDKLVKALSKGVEATASLKIKGAPRFIVYVFAGLIIVSVVLFLAAWVWKWWYGNDVDFDMMIKLLATLTSTSFIAAIAFFGKAMIDNDGDDVPDIWENKDKEKGSNHHEGIS